MSMRLKLLGVRGSRPTHKRALLGYGGNSTSFEICFDDEDFHLFVDGGSGLARRGLELTERPPRQRFHCLVTHTHWDHILGYPFFKPFYDKRNEFVFYASNTGRSSFNELFFGLQRRGNLPIPLTALKAKLRIEPITPGLPFMIEGRVQIDTFQLNHQGVTLGYRIQQGRDSVCIITDNAPINARLGRPPGSVGPAGGADGNYLGEGMAAAASGREADFERAFDAGLVEFMRGAHTVVFDTHFTAASLKPDWGHSTPPLALDFCKRAGVSRLILFHHAPEDSDGLVDDKVQSIFRDACQAGIAVEAAREGDEWSLCG